MQSYDPLTKRGDNVGRGTLNETRNYKLREVDHATR
jgi:hypothetical protein